MTLLRLVLICSSLAVTQGKSFVVKRSISRGYAIPSPPMPTDDSIGNVTSILDSDPIISSFHVNSNIEFRYARTIVESHVKNPSSISKEVTFTAIIPNSAFISNFSMAFDGVEYVATVAAKEEAKRVYEEAVTAGRGAGLVSQDVRDSNKFTVSANVESQAKVVFKMTYEELLERKLGWYEHVINVNPGQVVDDLKIVVNIDESRPLDKLSVPELKQSNEIDFESGKENEIAQLDWKQGNSSARIEFAPNKEQQEEYGEQGLAGQLLVKYDVQRDEEANEIQVIDGYFVHFFTPENLETLPKHIIFVLDISGSMSGDKIIQLKDAMFTILDDMTDQDYFNIITFSTSFSHWQLPSKDDPNEHSMLNPLLGPNYDYSYTTERNDLQQFNAIQATDENRREAIKYTNSINANGGTNINDGLLEGLKLAAEAKKNEALPTNLQSIVVFLSDGEATSGVTNLNTIKNNVKNANLQLKVPIYSLGFGRGADFNLIKDISTDAGAFAKHIYEDSDAALQLEDFFAEISSPLLSDLKFNYVGGLVDNSSISQHHLATFYKGGEFIVTGKLQQTPAQENDFLEVTVSASGENGTEYDHKESICLRPCVLPWADNMTGVNDIHYNAQLNPLLRTCPVTCLPPPPPPARSQAQNFLKNLYAFLNIKQLLKKTDETVNGTNPSKEKALTLSLANNFVTELTSLVVTRPNETAKISSLRDANAPQPQFLYAPEASEECADFTVGDCTITPDSIINQFETHDVHKCQEVCRHLSSCILFSHDGITCLLLSAKYRKGCGDVGAPVDTDVDICEDAIVHSCSGFDEENCEYLGESVGVDPPNEEVSDPLVCQHLCKTHSDLGCTFWVYKDKPQSCQLLKSSARSCTRISGPRAPPIDDCRKPKGCSAGTEFMGNCYELVQTNVDRDVAAEDCSSRGGALTSIHNQDVNSYLASLIVQRTWIGGKYKREQGVWVWPNGGQMDFTNWRSGEPNDLGSTDDCIEMLGSGEWNDQTCTDTLHYICQFPMTVLE